MTSSDYVIGEEAIGGGFTKFEHATVGVLYLLFCVVGVTTNFLTALTFYKDARLLSNGKPWLHICLALANIGVVAPSPFPASSSFSGRWLYGKTVCQVYAFEGMFVGMVAIGSVIGLCLERYYIANTLRSKSKETSGWFYGWTILLIVGNGFFWAVMPLLGWSSYDIEHTGTSCAINWKNPDESFISYMLTLMVFSFALPSAVAFFCLYSTHAKPVDQSTPASDGSGQGQASTSAQTTDQHLGPISEDQMQSLCYVFLLLMLTGWGPFALLCLVTILEGSAGLSMLAGCIPPLTCKLMVSMYPLAYAIISPRFKQSFKALLGGTDKKQD
uniref:Retinochrome n=1 Tax=Ambigolimax valentianus TaxID=1338344 RepID=A0A455S9V1_9EUPU|nr:retinochrome [Ambigolimax valentianus]